MDLSSFLTSLGTSLVIFLILVLVYSWLSSKPGNAVVYYPNRILKGSDPNENRSTSCSPFGWIREALSSTEEDVISMSGVDTAVYFVFLSTVLMILVLCGLVLLPSLLPVAATDDLLQQIGADNFTDLDKLSMANVHEKSPRLWAFLFAVYCVSFVTYYLLWRAYNHVSDLRTEALMSPELKPEQYVILVRDIPSVEGQTRKEQVDTYFKTIYPDTFYRSMIVTDNKEVNKLWTELEASKKKLVRAEAVHAESKRTGKSEARPTHKTGCLGILGKKVDSIEFYTEKISELVPKLEAEQKTTLRDKQLRAALVFFTSRIAATSAAQSLHAQLVDKWTVMEAPEPRQILWTNLKKTFYERQVRQYIVYIIVALTIFFYLIPIGFISAFTTLKNLMKLLPFLKPILKHNAVRTVLEAYLPQIALIVFLALLPKLLLFLSKAEGIPSLGHAIRAASGKYFYFSVLNVFIGVTLAGTLYRTFKKVQKDPNSIVDVLASSIPGNAAFFLTFVALKFFVGYGLELTRIVPLIIFHIKRKYVCKTEAEVKEAWFPGDLKYGTRVPGDLLVATIVLCYSVIAPLIIPFGVAYFGLGWLILRNQALKVYVPSYECYGRMWPHMAVRIIAALILYQVTMIGYFSAKIFYYTPFLIILPIISLLFAFFCHTKFYRSFHDTALEIVAREPKEIPNLDQVFRSFIPPCLNVEKNDDDQYEDALSQVSRSTSFV
ncbi:CSC1-like protein ERD4 [Humulus lupulus]|uniref:CSC1-like protein ERD4 n=1 Tax=Humulus lupulus TaxID=3486 RepID=UPI002B40C688|nr:CSC1-like protein ERD4 [Humulus lupulus]